MPAEIFKKPSPQAIGISCEKGHFLVPAEPDDTPLVKLLRDYTCKKPDGRTCPPHCQAQLFIEGKFKK